MLSSCTTVSALQPAPLCGIPAGPCQREKRRHGEAGQTTTPSREPAVSRGGQVLSDDSIWTLANMTLMYATTDEQISNLEAYNPIYKDRLCLRVRERA